MGLAGSNSVFTKGLILFGRTILPILEGGAGLRAAGKCGNVISLKLRKMVPGCGVDDDGLLMPCD